MYIVFACSHHWHTYTCIHVYNSTCTCIYNVHVHVYTMYMYSVHACKASHTLTTHTSHTPSRHTLTAHTSHTHFTLPHVTHSHPLHTLTTYTHTLTTLTGSVSFSVRATPELKNSNYGCQVCLNLGFYQYAYISLALVVNGIHTVHVHYLHIQCV